MVESVGLGSDLEKLQKIEDISNEIVGDPVSNEYYMFSVDCGPILQMLMDLVNSRSNAIELNDPELRTLAMQSGSYAFWDEPCENIYTLEDGNPL